MEYYKRKINRQNNDGEVMAIALDFAMLLREYTSKPNVIQALFDLPAGATISVTYSPPSGWTFIPNYMLSGNMATGSGYVTISFDGTVYVSNLYATDALKGMNDQAVPMYLRNELKFDTTNADVVTRTVDFLVYGYLIKTEFFEEFKSRLLRKPELDELKKINDNLRELISLIKLGSFPRPPAVIPRG